jgi:hydroxymethylpyrimidine/phosphomethylpyrimidine kinase
MTTALTTTPVVMAVDSHDPSGCTGTAANIETLRSLGCHCTAVISQIAVQDTDSYQGSQPAETAVLISQMRAVLEDMPVDLIKVGTLGSLASIEAVHTVLRDYPSTPVVLAVNSDLEYADALTELLLPLTQLMVINARNTYRLAPSADSLAACVQELLEFGGEHILVTNCGAHSASNPHVTNQLFNHRGLSQHYQWPRLTHSVKGAQCTLSAAASAYLAHGLSLAESVQQAQQFSWQAMHNAMRLGMGQLIPNRLHWCDKG